MKTQTSYKVASIALLAIFVTMITPSTAFSTSDSTALTVYGMADLVHKDGAGNVLFEQTIHNAITDEGEDYLVNQVFATATAPTDTASTIGTICISDNFTTGDNADGSTAAARVNDDDLEAATASNLSTAIPTSYTTNADCVADPDGVSITNSVATITAQFIAGTNVQAAGGSINALFICADTSATVCTDTALAVVTTTAQDISGSDTIDVTYTFDLRTPTS